MPLAADRPVMARPTTTRLETAGRGFALMLTLDPVTLAELCHRFWGEYATTWLMRPALHALAGPAGRLLVGGPGAAARLPCSPAWPCGWPGRSACGRP